MFQPDRKAVAAKDVVSTPEAYESDIREYQILTDNAMDITMMVVNQKRYDAGNDPRAAGDP